MKNWILGVSVLLGVNVFAQGVEAVSSDIIFPDTYENAASTAEVKIYNPTLYPIQVVDIDFFEIYGDKPFSSVDTTFMLMPSDTFTVTVNFLPEHNIYHDMDMVVKTASGFGHKVIKIEGQAKYSKAYYNTTENKSEEALKTALKTKLGQGYNSLGYTNARDNMYGSIDNNTNGKVECVYTGRQATFNTRAGANSNQFNCEHTFPQGKFSSNEPMRSDIHHLFPTDVSANSTRGNDPFGVVSSASWQQGGSKSGGSKFEPRDVHKGTAARAMMYFVTRYQDYQNFFVGQESILRAWHKQYPPSTQDIARNNAIAALQNSRNPFVDYPQFVERIHKLVSNSVAPAVKAVYFSDDTLYVRDGVNQRFEYDFIVYNQGNQDISLSNAQLSDTSLHFVNAVSSTPIAPGDYEVMTISYNAGESYTNDFLSFNTDVPNATSVHIPIVSSAKVEIEERTEIAQNIKVYPNPSDDVLYVDVPAATPIKLLHIINVIGETKVILETDAIDVSKMPKGIYFLHISLQNGESVIRKVIVE